MIVLLALVCYALVLSLALGRAGNRLEGSSSSTGASTPRPQRLLIIGATGGTGRQVVVQALERGYEVTALVRDPSRLQLVHPRLTTVRGDVLDRGSVEAAMRGQEAVLSALGHKQYFRPTRILSEGTRNILRAMEDQGAGRFVCETTLGIGDSVGRLGLFYTLFVIPVILPFYFWDKTRQERVIAASAAEWVIVRPGALTNGEKRGTIRHGPHLGSFVLTKRISRADVAAFMLDQLTSDTYLRRAPGVIG
jgi:nucleoside-diphosphate-sugar epimerase